MSSKIHASAHGKRRTQKFIGPLFCLAPLSVGNWTNFSTVAYTTWVCTQHTGLVRRITATKSITTRWRIWSSLTCSWFALRYLASLRLTGETSFISPWLKRACFPLSTFYWAGTNSTNSLNTWDTHPRTIRTGTHKELNLVMMTTEMTKTNVSAILEVATT